MRITSAKFLWTGLFIVVAAPLIPLLMQLLPLTPLLGAVIMLVGVGMLLFDK